MSIPISQFLPPTLPHSCLFICSLHLCLYFCFANPSICTIFLDSSYMRWYVIFFPHLLILILKDSVLEISGTWPYFPGITWGRHKPAAQPQEGNYESRSLCSTNPSCTPVSMSFCSSLKTQAAQLGCGPECERRFEASRDPGWRPQHPSGGCPMERFRVPWSSTPASRCCLKNL